MISTRSFIVATAAGSLGWLATQKVREQVPGAMGFAIAALAGMVVETTASRWLEQNI